MAIENKLDNHLLRETAEHKNNILLDLSALDNIFLAEKQQIFRSFEFLNKCKNNLRMVVLYLHYFYEHRIIYRFIKYYLIMLLLLKDKI